MTKVVINSEYGGFGLSDEAFEKLLDRKGIAWEKQMNSYGTAIDYYHAGHLDDDAYYLSYYDFFDYDNRADPDLVAIVEALGKKSWGQYAVLKIVDIPDDVKWHIEEYDGLEHVAEDHRIWD